MNIKKSLDICLAERGMNYNELSKKSGVARQTIGNWKRGSTIPKALIDTVENVFKIKLSEFIAKGE